jgi:acetyltransferase-like isoleucine patch superfamily enzyme
MDWNNNLCSKKDCQIDEKTIISGNYQLNKVKIGLGTAIGKNANILNTDIGKFCSIGPNFLCGWGIHPTNGISINPAFYSTAKQNGFTYSEVDKIVEQKSIYIGNDVFIGANVTVLDGVTINDGAIIGAGAVVSKDIPPYAIAVGCPIQIIRYRFSQEIIVELLDIKWWDRNESVLKKVEKNFFDVTLFIKEIRANKGEL